MRAALLAACLVACADGDPSAPGVTRDPRTGQCLAGAGQPGWPDCESVCNTLDESECRGHPQCQGIYDPSAIFRACWPTARRGGAAPDCAALDAVACAGEDGCRAFYAFDGSAPGFAACQGKDAPLLPLVLPP